jgi:autotransporter translocation and assembly factor TamB
MDLKKEFISKLLENSLKNAKAQLSGVGGLDLLDSIDKELLVSDMYLVCELTGEQLIQVDTALNSMLYKAYEKSITSMSEVVFKFMIAALKKEVKTKTTH